MFDWITHEVSNNPTTYLIVFVAAATDVLFPVVPSETIVITAAILAANGELFIWLIVPAAALGAVLGDNVAYWLGRRVGDPIAKRVFRGEKGQKRLRWAERAVHNHGVLLIILGRFIPGGRTATTFAAGTLEMNYLHRFLPTDIAAAFAWAIYISMLGFIGGATFEDNLLLPLAIAFGIATAVGLGIEGWRRYRRAHGQGDPLA